MTKASKEEFLNGYVLADLDGNDWRVQMMREWVWNKLESMGWIITEIRGGKEYCKLRRGGTTVLQGLEEMARNLLPQM